MDFAGWKFKHRMAFSASDSRVDFAPLELPTARFQQSFAQKKSTMKKLMRMHNEENLHLQLAQKAISTNIFGILKFKIIHDVGYLKPLHVRSFTLYYGGEWKSSERNESENCHALRSALTVNYCYEMRRIYGFLGLSRNVNRNGNYKLHF